MDPTGRAYSTPSDTLTKCGGRSEEGKKEWEGKEGVSGVLPRLIPSYAYETRKQTAWDQIWHTLW